MYDMILIRYGDLTLKGKNKKRFINQAITLVKDKTANAQLTFLKHHDRLYINLNGEDHTLVIEALMNVSGLAGFSLLKKTDKTLDAIATTAIELLTPVLDKDSTFKVETKRADKNFPIPSMDISRRIAGQLLKTFPQLSVDVKKPDKTLYIEVRSEHAYVYLDKIKGLGGFPVGVAGKGLLLLSGGIDSPVAGFLAMKQGIAIEAFHFESTPLTSIESAQKALDIVKTLSVYAPKDTIKVHFVPFTPLHEKILNYVPEPYQITIMRRMMVRLADRFAERDHTQILITGESVGQVASQTLESLNVVNAVTTRPIIRPLATTDKSDIIALARTIKTYDISIRPFEDCCAIYTPEQPTTSPRDYYAKRYERLFDYETLIEETLQGIMTLDIHKDDPLNITGLALTVSEALSLKE